MKMLGSTGWFAGLGFGALAVWGGLGCTPGYIKAESLEAQGQGPSACAKSCEDLGMRMTAMVLVGDSVPGCVCQPQSTQPAAPALGTQPTTPAPLQAQPQSVNDGAAASTTGYVVLAAAAAARQQQERQRVQAQQSTKH